MRQFFLGIDRILTRDAASSQSAFQTAEKIDPLNPFIPFVQIWAATALGDSETALRKAERTLELDPAFSYFTDPLVYAYGSFGRWQDCVARSAAAPAGAGTQREPDYKAAVCYAHLGDTGHARRILSQLETAAQKRYVDHVNIAEIHAALGEKDDAFRALEQAYHDRSQPLLVVWFVPEFRSLADDPRYRALMEKTYCRPEAGDDALRRANDEWSGRWESNPRLKLGKLGYYHYTTPATGQILVGLLGVRKLTGSRRRGAAQNRGFDNDS